MPSADINARWIERLEAPKEGRKEYFDKKFAGLGVRASASGKKVWFVVYRVKGDKKLRRITVGGYPAVSLADAREKAQEILLAAERGRDPGTEIQEAKSASTLKELAVEYMARHAIHKRSQKEDRRILDKDILPVLGQRKAHEIRRREVIALLEAIKDRGAPIGANRTLALLRKVYNFGIERDLVEVNPCSQIKRMAPEKPSERVLTDSEIRTVWKAFESLDLVIGSMFKLRLITAQRGGEVESMRWADVEDGWWTIPAERAKNGHSHRVPLSRPALRLLEALKVRTGKQEWVFPSPTRKGQHIANIQKAAKRVQEDSGVDFVLHDLRRTAASKMTGMKIPRLVVSKILNHAESGVTGRVYDRHDYDAEKREALDAWATALEGILAGKSTKVRQISEKQAAAKPKQRAGR